MRLRRSTKMTSCFSSKSSASIKKTTLIHLPQCPQVVPCCSHVCGLPVQCHVYSVEITILLAYLQDLTSMDPYGNPTRLYGGLMLMSQKLTPMPANGRTPLGVSRSLCQLILRSLCLPSQWFAFTCCKCPAHLIQQWVIGNAKQDRSHNRCFPS